MKKHFLILATIFVLLSSLIGMGEVKPARAEAPKLADVAGITAWYSTGAPIDPANFAGGLSTIEYQDADVIIGTIDIPVYVDEYNPYVLVHSSGYIAAFYPNTDPAGKMVDVIGKTLNTTLLKYAVVMVGAAGGYTIADVTYYDFSNPQAKQMLVLAENRADGENAFSLTLPPETIEIVTEEGTETVANYTYYDKSYGFYQTYLPEFTLNDVNFVLDNADFVGPGYYGSIFGHFRPDENLEDEIVITDLVPGEESAFTVDSGSTSAFGAVVVSYAIAEGATGAIDVVDADQQLDLTLAVPGTIGLVTFDLTPGAFNKSTPVDGAEGQLLNATLDWSESTSPNYEYCIDTIDNDACDTGWLSTGSVDPVTLSGLLFDTTYYWQVRASNSSGTVEADGGTWWSFKTEGIKAPAAFTKLSPVTGTSGLSPNGVVLDWNESYGAYSYEYCVTEAASCTDADWINVGSATTATVSDLAFETTYNWQVRAVNDDFTTYADGGTLWSFTTLDTFSKLSPVDLATGVKTRATLTWEKLGASTYEYCIDADETANDTCDTDWKSTGTATKVTLSIVAGKTYTWQVRANNGTDIIDANEGVWWSFTVKAKVVPTKRTVLEKISPKDKATDVPTTATLKWINIGASKYEYCIDTSLPTNESCAWENAGTANSVTLDLDYPTTYYWQVRATVGTEIIYADKGFWQFTTMFTKTDPANHAEGLSVDSVLLKWQPVTGATYEYCLDTDEYCNSWVSTTAAEAALSGLAYGTTYYWQVRATVDDVKYYADGSTSAYWRFSTEELTKVSPKNGAIDQPINITLDWGEVTGAIAYEYCLYSDTPCIEWTSTAESSTATLTNLEYETIYHWQVRANVGSVDEPIWLYADDGAYWTFTTIAAPVEP